MHYKMNIILFISLLIFIGLSLAGCGNFNALTPEQELKNLDATEKQVLVELLKGTGLSIESLRPVGIFGIKRNPKAIAVEKTHIVGLHLTGVTLLDLSPAKRLAALEVLELTQCKLPSLIGLNGHTTLRELALVNNDLTFLQGLANLPQLHVLNLDDNKLSSLAELKGMPILKKLSARNNQLTKSMVLGKETEIILEGNPINNPAVPALSANFVTKLPESNGKTTGDGPHHTKGLLLGSPPLEVSGIYDSLTGTATLGIVHLENADPTANVRAFGNHRPCPRVCRGPKP